MNTQDTDNSQRTEGYQDDLIEGVAEARDHRIAAVNTRTMIAERWVTEDDLINESELVLTYEDERTLLSWESGPYKWVWDILGGNTLGSTAYPSRRQEADLFPDLFRDNPNIEVECHNGFTLSFRDK